MTSAIGDRMRVVRPLAGCRHRRMRVVPIVGPSREEPAHRVTVRHAGQAAPITETRELAGVPRIMVRKSAPFLRPQVTSLRTTHPDLARKVRSTRRLQQRKRLHFFMLALVSARHRRYNTGTKRGVCLVRCLPVRLLIRATARGVTGGQVCVALADTSSEMKTLVACHVAAGGRFSAPIAIFG